MIVVSGTDIVLYYHDPDSGDDIPFACSDKCILTITPSFKNVTDYQSAFFAKILPDVAEWNISVSGLITLSNYSYLFMTDLQQSRETILVKFVIDNGADGLVIYAGNVYMGQIVIDGTYDQKGTYSTTLMGTGAYNSTGTTVTPGGVIIEGGTVTRFEYTVVTGGTTISVSSIIGANSIVGLSRGGSTVSEIITSGSPTGNQVKFDPSGTLEVAIGNEWLAGEEISGQYK